MSGDSDEGRALAERLLSDEMISQVQWAISEAQVHGHVEYKRRVGYHGRVTIARTVLDAICEHLGVPTSIDLLMEQHAHATPTEDPR